MNQVFSRDVASPFQIEPTPARAELERESRPCLHCGRPSEVAELYAGPEVIPAQSWRPAGLMHRNGSLHERAEAPVFPEREDECTPGIAREYELTAPPPIETIVGRTFKVIDPAASIRSGPPSFAPTKGSIPRGQDVTIVTVGIVGDAIYVEVRAPGLAPGTWTKLSNLDVPAGAVLARIEASSDPNDTKGPTAAWEDGKFLGQVALLDVLNSQRQPKRVSADTYPYFLAMAQAAKAEGVDLSINSGFRTYAEQKYFRDLYDSGKGNQAAQPGSSNHQHGKAYDINVAMGKGGTGGPVSAWTPAYRWLVRNAGRFGFQRAVKGERWHWEYRPETAANDPVFGDKALLLQSDGATV